MEVINLFGGPGAGKSTTAAGVFRQMKLRGLNVELVTEYAKDMVWEHRHNILEDQFYIFAKQHRRQARLRGQVDYVVTDSPLLLSLIYKDESYSPSFERFVLETWGAFNNFNILLRRVKPYTETGRMHTQEQADALGLSIESMLRDYDMDYTVLFGDESAVDHILNMVV